MPSVGPGLWRGRCGFIRLHPPGRFTLGIQACRKGLARLPCVGMQEWGGCMRCFQNISNARSNHWRISSPRIRFLAKTRRTRKGWPDLKPACHASHCVEVLKVLAPCEVYQDRHIYLFRAALRELCGMAFRRLRCLREKCGWRHLCGSSGPRLQTGIDFSGGRGFWRLGRGLDGNSAAHLAGRASGVSAQQPFRTWDGLEGA